LQYNVGIINVFHILFSDYYLSSHVLASINLPLNHLDVVIDVVLLRHCLRLQCFVSVAYLTVPVCTNSNVYMFVWSINVYAYNISAIGVFETTWLRITL